MSVEFKDRNKDMVQLYKVGWTKYAIAKLFNLNRHNVKRLIVRDFDKYPAPTLDELRIIEERYHIKVGEIKSVDSPYSEKKLKLIEIQYEKNS